MIYTQVLEISLNYQIAETCYAFINGWNDIISSLEVHSGKNCIFFEDYGCDMGSERKLSASVECKLGSYAEHEFRSVRFQKLHSKSGQTRLE